jgi:hypothetical protein
LVSPGKGGFKNKIHTGKKKTGGEEGRQRRGGRRGIRPLQGERGEGSERKQNEGERRWEIEGGNRIGKSENRKI